MAEPEMSFEDLLTCPYLQFDPDNELLPHMLAFGPPSLTERPSVPDTESEDIDG